MSMTSSTTDDLTIFEVDRKTKFSVGILKAMLTEMEVALFFAKVYDLSYDQLVKLLRLCFNSTVLDALTAGDHSTELQDYIVDTVPPAILNMSATKFTDVPPPGEVLPELWASFHLVIADSIKKVAQAVKHTIDIMPSKHGKMVFSHMAQLNKQRNSIGVYGAGIHHERQLPNLVIVDDSGSVTRQTVLTLLADVIALSWDANATLALVSNTARVWEPGSYDHVSVASAIENGGTHYETLTPLLSQHWGTVVTIADYDSSLSAKEYIAANAKGTIEQLLDISLVNRPTFLAECVGQLANNMQPLLVGNSGCVLNS